MDYELLYSGFSSPVTLTSVPNEPDHLYVGDQIGVIYRIAISTGKIDIFLDLRRVLVDLERKYDERGLLDFVFHPKYPLDPRLFIFYSSNLPDSESNNGKYVNYLSEFQISDQFGDQFEFEETPFLIIQKDVPNHNSGRMIFGPDLLLYVSIGDGGKQMDPDNNAQRLDNIYGKILRLDVSVPGTYKIPLGNSLIYAFGFRNPWGMSFNSQSQLFVADVGYNDVEELNIIDINKNGEGEEGEGKGGGNYGWNIKEGTMKTKFGLENVTQTPLIDPVFEYTHDWIRTMKPSHPDMIAIIGGYPLPDGSYVFGDLSGLIMRIKKQEGNGEQAEWQMIDHVKFTKFIKGFGKDSKGQVYILASDGISPYSNGVVYLLNFHS